MRIVGVLICALPLLAGSMAKGQDAGREYSVNQNVPETGSHIARALATSTRIPLDKDYAALTPEQQGLLKSQYNLASSADEPPFPLAGLAPIYKAIINSQPNAPVSGDLTILVDVDSKGDAGSTSIVQSTDPQVARIAARALAREKYKPAVCSGHPCPMQFRFQVWLSAR
jgi:hypothetical protein